MPLMAVHMQVLQHSELANSGAFVPVRWHYYVQMHVPMHSVCHGRPPGDRRRIATAGAGGRLGNEGMLTVDHPQNGVSASLLRATPWRKSSFSNPSGNCVEAALLPAEGVAVRNSRFPDGPALIFTDAEWDAFIRGVKAGDFG